MKRIKYFLLFAIYVLALVNLAVALPKPEVKLDFDPDKVERIELFSMEDHHTEYPRMQTDRYRQYSAPIAIRRLCEVFSNLYIQEYPYDELSEGQKEEARRETQWHLYRIVMKNGRVVEFYQSGQFLRVGDHWCYAIGGEEDGYQPFYYAIADIEREYCEFVRVEQSAE